MDMREFNGTVVRTETAVSVTFDVRPFGDRQGEAVDSYLHDVGMALQMNVFRHSKPIVLLCDSNATIPTSADSWLANVHSQGVAIEIQRA